MTLDSEIQNNINRALHTDKNPEFVVDLYERTLATLKRACGQRRLHPGVEALLIEVARDISAIKAELGLDAKDFERQQELEPWRKLDSGTKVIVKWRNGNCDGEFVKVVGDRLRCNFVWNNQWQTGKDLELDRVTLEEQAEPEVATEEELAAANG